jgi:hypothetical protein
MKTELQRELEQLRSEKRDRKEKRAAAGRSEGSD